MHGVIKIAVTLFVFPRQRSMHACSYALLDVIEWIPIMYQNNMHAFSLSFESRIKISTIHSSTEPYIYISGIQL